VSGGTPTAAGAIAAWHDALAADTGRAEASWVQLKAALDRDGIGFGGRPLCTVLRPRLLAPAEYARLATALRALMRAFAAAGRRAAADPAARAQFRLLDWEETLFGWETGGLEPSPLGRMDTFIDPGTGTLQVTEFNAETPAGPFYNDAIARAFEQLPITRAIARDWWVRPLHAGPGTLQALLDHYATWCGVHVRPRIAILDWPEVPTQAEFRLAQAHCAAQGIACVIGDPRECEFRGGRLWLDGAPVDLVYKRVLLTELVQRTGLDGAVLQAVRAGAVCMANGIRAKVLHKKASLAVLSDERNAAWFDADMQRAIAAHVPWTRVVEARRTRTPDGTEADLLPWCEANQDRLALKPSDDYGGHGIVLGWTVDAAEWRRALAAAEAAPTVVQDRIVLPREAFPGWGEDGLAWADRQVDTAPYIAHGGYVDGVLTRLSTEALLNVTAGGGSQAPTFLIEPRA
jgi:uncharacterized circularly permuted ATP-grasp superfamily protein